MKKALITGITGQDGAYLARFLLEKGYLVSGAYRRSSSLNLSRLERLGVSADEPDSLDELELLEPSNVRRLIERIAPDEIYNLAGQTFVGVSFEQPEYTFNVNTLGVLHLLEAIREINPKIKFYQASTSEMFGTSPPPQNEETRFNPCSPYGIAKLAAHWLVGNYRRAHKLHACSGILFNHESPLRGPEFVTQKIAQGLARILRGEQDQLRLGNLNAKRDWGFAGDYVEAIWLMLQAEQPQDYVIATGQTCTVKGFLELVALELNMDLDWRGEGENTVARWKGKEIIRIDPRLYRPEEVELLCGDARKAELELGWKAKTTLPELARMMAREALIRSA